MTLKKKILEIAVDIGLPATRVIRKKMNLKFL
jgi:hypothetical protein